MKKIIAVLLAATMILNLAACGGSTAGAAEEVKDAVEAEVKEAAKDDSAADSGETAGLPYEGVTLEYWWPPYSTGDEDTAFWAKQFEKFTAETGAEVNITVVPWEDMAAKYMTGFMSGEGPDVFYMTNEITYDMKEAGALLDVAPYFTDEEKANQLFFKSGYAVGDEVYTIPIYGGCDFRNFVYNLDLLEAAGVEGVPETWDEVIDAATKMKETGVCEYPILFGSGSNPIVCLLPLIWSAGGDIVTADGSAATLDSPEVLSACQFLYDLSNTYEVLSKDSVTFDSSKLFELFTEGKVGMMLSKPDLELEGKDQIPFNWTSVTAIHKDGCKAITFSAYDSMAVNANSKNLDAAVALFKFVMSTECREAFRSDMAEGVAALNADMAPTEYSLDHVAASVATITEHGKSMPICKGVTSIVELIQTNQQLLTIGEITPEEACEAMQEGATAILEE